MHFFRVAALALLCASCSSSAISQADAAAQLAQVLCAELQFCCQGAPGLPALSVCVSTTSANIASSLAGQLANPDSAYDQGAAARCIADLQGSSCEELALDRLDTDPNCAAIVHGTLPLSAPCSHGAQCASGLCANLAATSSGAAVGVCAAPQVANQSCAADGGTSDGAPCAAGTFAQASDGSCLCLPLYSLGTACDDPSQCQSGDCGVPGSGACPPADVCIGTQCIPIPVTSSLGNASCAALIQTY